MSNVEELERALEYPWEKWTVFLHPAQRNWLRGITAARHASPVRQEQARPLLLCTGPRFWPAPIPMRGCFSPPFQSPLANALRTKVRRLISNEPRLAERLEVHAMDAIGLRLYEINFGRPRIAAPETIRQLLEEASHEVEGHRFSLHFLFAEWEQVVDAWQLDTWEAYRDVARLGRKTRLPEKQRAVLWSIFEQVRAKLAAMGLVTHAAMFTGLQHILQETAVCPSISSLSMKHRMWASASCAFSPPLREGGLTAFSLPGTSVSAFSDSPFRGRPSALMSGEGPEPCASTTVPHIRSGCRLIGSWGLSCPMSTAMLKTGGARFPFSTDRSR